MAKQYPPMTLQKIGDEFGFTRERARQLIRDHGWEKTSFYQGTVCPTCKVRYKGDIAVHRQTRDHQRAIMDHRAALGDERRNWDKMAIFYAMYEAGWSNGEMVRATGTYANAPTRYLTMLGLDPYRLRGRPWPRLNPQQAAVRDRQVALAYAEGVETDTILEMFGLGRGNLTRIVRNYGAYRPDWYRREYNGFKIWHAKQKAMSDKA